VLQRFGFAASGWVTAIHTYDICARHELPDVQERIAVGELRVNRYLSQLQRHRTCARSALSGLTGALPKFPRSQRVLEPMDPPAVGQLPYVLLRWRALLGEE
jgi:hypothetical protein